MLKWDMMKRISEKKAHAKINLLLKVVGKRDDGYHELSSVMQSVSLCDDVRVECMVGRDTIQPDRGVDIQLTFERDPEEGIPAAYPPGLLEEIPTDEKNTVYVAVRAFLERHPFTIQVGGHNGVLTTPDDGCHYINRIHIHIIKRIPTAAGLAGGSADAAAALWALSELYAHNTGKTVTLKELDEIALAVGADVPFCLREGTALASGIGEILENLAPLPKELWILLANPGYPVSTAWAFRQWSEQTARPQAQLQPQAQPQIQLQVQPRTEYGPNFINMIVKLLQDWYNDVYGGDTERFIRELTPYLDNDLEYVTAAKHPEILTIKNCMIDCGAACAMMSGSGASVFGIFASESAAAGAKKTLNKNGFWATVCAGSEARITKYNQRFAEKEVGNTVL